MSQTERIIDFLRSRGSCGATAIDFTQLPPRGLGIQNYKARISEIKQQGKPIICKKERIDDLFSKPIWRYYLDTNAGNKQ
jgi:hypothetical protein